MLDRRAGEGQPDTWWRMYCGPESAGESRGRLSLFDRHLAEGLGSVRSMRRAERSQGDMQLARGKVVAPLAPRQGDAAACPDEPSGHKSDRLVFGSGGARCVTMLF